MQGMRLAGSRPSWSACADDDQSARPGDSAVAPLATTHTADPGSVPQLYRPVASGEQTAIWAERHAAGAGLGVPERNRSVPPRAASALTADKVAPTSAQSLPAQPQRGLRQDADVTLHAFTSACVAVLTGPMAFEQAPLASRHAVCTAGSRRTQSACSRRAVSAVALGLVPAGLM